MLVLKNPSRLNGIETSSGEYYASFVCEYIPVKTNGTGIVGIDVGITDLFTISDGTIIDNPRHFVKSQKKLARYQRQHARFAVVC